MLRRYHRFFQSVQVLRDAALVALAFVLAYNLRFAVPHLLPYGQISSMHETVAVALMLVFIWPTVGWAGGLYNSRRGRTLFAEVFDVFKTTVVAFLVLVTMTYFLRDVRYSRAVIILWAACNVTLLASVRLASRAALQVLRQRGYNLRHVVVIGLGDLSSHVMDMIATQPSLGLRVIGAVALESERRRVGDRVGSGNSVPVLGSVGELADIVAERNVDQVLVALPIHQLGALQGIMEVLSRETVDVRLIPDFYQYVTLCGSVEEFSGMPIINLQSTPLFGWNLVVKRVFDLLIAGTGWLLISPLFLCLALLVRLTSRGPVFYRQERIGMDGQRFDMFKFRTMYVDAEESGARMAVASDPRCTPVGALLRRFSLDELPQLWNVVRGDMSLVGPRPERPCFIEDFKRDIPRYALRHKIKAGMTGWAQINGMRGNTSITKRIEMDLYYIENWSLTLDIKILLRTVLGGFLSPNAY